MSYAILKGVVAVLGVAGMSLLILLWIVGEGVSEPWGHDVD